MSKSIVSPISADDVFFSKTDEFYVPDDPSRYLCNIYVFHNRTLENGLVTNYAIKIETAMSNTNDLLSAENNCTRRIHKLFNINVLLKLKADWKRLPRTVAGKFLVNINAK